MREILCDTSPLQYLHQLGCLELLPRIAENVVVPPAVVRDLAEGKAAGYNVSAPDGLAWITVCRPLARLERLVGDLGAGETEVLMLALERPDAVAIIDDKLAPGCRDFANQVYRDAWRIARRQTQRPYRGGRPLVGPARRIAFPAVGAGTCRAPSRGRRVAVAHGHRVPLARQRHPPVFSPPAARFLSPDLRTLPPSRPTALPLGIWRRCRSGAGWGHRRAV